MCLADLESLYLGYMTVSASTVNCCMLCFRSTVCATAICLFTILMYILFSLVKNACTVPYVSVC